MKNALRAMLIFAVAIFAAVPALAQSQAIQTYNNSVVITLGNTFQKILGQSTGRRSLTIQNNNATDSCWIEFGSINGVTITFGTATKANSILLLAGQSLSRYAPFVPADEIEGTCPTTGDTLYVDIQ